MAHPTTRRLSLQAYLALGRGTPVRDASPDPLPAGGPVVWLHATTDEAGRALARVGGRLRLQRPEIALVGTGAVPPQQGLHVLTLPEDRAAPCDAFAAALAPRVGLWAGHALRPALIDAVARCGAYLALVDARDAAWTTPAPGWLPDPAPATLALFDIIHATDEAAFRTLRRQGVDGSRMRVSGILRDGGLPRDCDDALHERLAAQFAGRPIWLGALLRAAEADAVLRAHRQALRLAHRLLLLAVPADEAEAHVIARTAQDLGLRLCDWDAGETPDENTQVLMVEGPEALGLWYRLAPLAFIGGSLVPGHGGEDPFEAAALGCALLYGPNVGQHLSAYTQLVDAGAARIVRDADSLAAAVSHLVAPDKAAAMALAGWSVVSAGAELIDSVIADVCAVLDEPRRGAS